jgi:hypothetical protein
MTIAVSRWDISVSRWTVPPFHIVGGGGERGWVRGGKKKSGE